MHILQSMKHSTTTFSCGLCQSKGAICDNCKMEEELQQPQHGDERVLDKGGDGRQRSKSPMVNSAERDAKCHRVDIGTPGGRTLPDLPLFPAMTKSEPNASAASNSNDGTKVATATATVTIDAIAELLENKLRPVNTTMEKLESQMSHLSLEVNEKFKVLETKMSIQDVRVAKLEEMLKSGPTTKNDCELQREVGKLREELNALKTSKTHKTRSK